MSEISSILIKIDALKALVARDSITPLLLGSLLAEIVRAIPDVAAVSDELKAADSRLAAALNDEISDRQRAQEEIARRIDALLGDNASDTIDNFREVLTFLDGIKDTDRLSAKLTELSTALKDLDILAKSLIASLPSITYQTVSLSELNGWLAKRPIALLLQGPGQMLRIVENEAVVATAEWYSNYSPENGECWDGVMRVRGYGIVRGTNDSDDMLAYDPSAAPGFVEWEIVDGGDHWDAPVRVNVGGGGECGCPELRPFTNAELDAIWDGATVPDPGTTGAFTPEDLDRFWDETSASEN